MLCFYGLYMSTKVGDIATFLDKFHVMYSDLKSGNLTYCLEGIDILAWLMFLNSVAIFVILSFSSVYYMEGNVIGCIKWKDITKIITTHWYSTEHLSICCDTVISNIASVAL
jgi:hypothetical protein